MMRRLLRYWYPFASLVFFVYLYIAHRDASSMTAETYHALWNLNCFIFIFSIFASPPLHKRRIPRKVQARIDAEDAEIARQSAKDAAHAKRRDFEQMSSFEPTAFIAASNVDDTVHHRHADTHHHDHSHYDSGSHDSGGSDGGSSD